MKKIITLLALAAAFTTLMVSCQQNFSAVEDIKPAELFKEEPAKNVFEKQWDASLVTLRSLGGSKDDIKAGIYTVTFTGEKDENGNAPALQANDAWWAITFNSKEGESTLEFTLTDDDVAIMTGHGCECGKHYDAEDPKDASGGDICFVCTAGKNVTITGFSYKPLPAPTK